MKFDEISAHENYSTCHLMILDKVGIWLDHVCIYYNN